MESLEALELLYEQKVKEHNTKKSEIDREIGALQSRNEEFNKLMSQIPESALIQFGLKSDKKLEDMSDEEVLAFTAKAETAYVDLYNKLKHFLKTGEYEESSTLIESLTALSQVAVSSEEIDTAEPRTSEDLENKSKMSEPKLDDNNPLFQGGNH